ncbi:MAG: hypothetical protein HC805_08735 [Alkalinema sp. RL_2_19]|nr:hypothetical protein [Alkalinema sp. RL_2_19]
MQDWRDIRDDLPPNDGSLVPTPTGGGGNPGGNTVDQQRSSEPDATPQNPTAFNSSVFFSQSAYVNLSWSLLDSSHGNEPIASDSTPIALGENQPAAAAKLLVEALRAALPTLEVQLQQTDSGWQIVIAFPTGQAVQTIALADLAGDRMSLINQIQQQVQRLTTTTIVNPADAITQIVQAAQMTHVAQAEQPTGSTRGHTVIDISSANASIDAGNNAAGDYLVAYRAALTGVTIDLGANQPLVNVANLEGHNFVDRLVNDHSHNTITNDARNNTISNDVDNGVVQAQIQTQPQTQTPNPNNIVGLNYTSATTTATPLPETPLPKPDNEWIFAGSGDDLIDAGDGNNFIAAGTGDNRIISGKGIDLFVLGSWPRCDPNPALPCAMTNLASSVATATMTWKLPLQPANPPPAKFA